MNYSKSRLRRLQLCLSCALFSLPAMLFAGPHQVDGHAHGFAGLNMAVERSSVAIEYISPVINITGFEPAATLPSKVQAADEAASTLQYIDVTVFTLFHGNERIDAQVVTAAGRSVPVSNCTGKRSYNDL